MSNRLRERGFQVSKPASYTPEGTFYQPVGREEHPLGPPTAWPTGVSGALSEGGQPYRDNVESSLLKSPTESADRKRIMK